MRKNTWFILVVALLLVFNTAAWPGLGAFAQASSLEWSPAGPDSLLNEVTCLLSVDAQLYKGTAGTGVFVWNGDDWTQAGTSWPSENGYAVGVVFLTDISGTLYAGTDGSGILALENGSWTQVGASSWLSENMASCLAELNGTLYAGSWGGVWVLDNGTWTQVGASSWPLAYGVFPDTASGLVKVGETLYVQTTFNGVYALGSGGEWSQAGTAWPAPGGDADWANCLLADAGGTLYAGTGQSGVWAMDNGVWTQLGTWPSGDEVSNLAEVSGMLYAGTDNGMWTWNGEEWSTVTGFPFSADNDYVLASSGDTLYCGGGNHVYTLNDGFWQEIGSWNGLPIDDSGNHNLPTLDVNGTLYAGTFGGVWALGNGAWTQVGASSWPLVNGFADRACSLLLDGGVVYAGTGKSGVYALGSSGEWSPVGSAWPPGNGAGYGAWCLTSVDGEVYAGTYDWDTSYNGGTGVLALNGDTWAPVGTNIDHYWVTDLTSVSGTVYASTWGGGVWALEGGEWTSLDSGPYPRHVYTLEVMDGTLYAGGYENDVDCILWAWDGTSWTEKAFAQTDGPQLIYGLNKTGGTLYAATEQGVYSVDVGNDCSLSQVGSYSRSCASAADVGGTLYTGTEGNGVLALVVPVAVITVNGAGNADTVASGSTLQMSADVLPADAMETSVTWSVIQMTGMAAIDQTGLLTGIGAGTVTVRATANDGSGVYGEKVITITAAGTAPTITTTTLSGGTVGTPYSQTLTATGAATVAWSVYSGSLPGGLSLATDTGVISGTPTASGTFNFTVQAANEAGNNKKAFSIVISPTSSGGGSSTLTAGLSSGTSTTVSGNTSTATTTTAAASDGTGKAAASVTQTQISDAVSKAVEEAEKQGNGMAARVEIKVEAPADVKTVETSIPKGAVELTAEGKTDALTISTPVAAITFDKNALSTISDEAAGDVKITASKIEASSLPAQTQQIVGDRPVFNFSVTSGDKTISQFGGNVSVSVPYTPKAGEDTNAIVIYYINAQGGLEIVSNCKYDPATGSITFNTSHFSQYAVGYNKVSFKDVSADAWYSDAVGFIAARGITLGTGNGHYSPEAKLTRGEFLVMLMRAYGIKPDTDMTNNFSDAGNAYYSGYLAAAKRLSISAGVGSNMFEPDREITRQEMFTLLYNALKVMNELPTGTSGKSLESYSDAGQIAAWAKDAMTLFAQTGTISGSEGKLTPADTTTRAEMAKVLYNLLAK